MIELVGVLLARRYSRAGGNSCPATTHYNTTASIRRGNLTCSGIVFTAATGIHGYGGNMAALMLRSTCNSGM